MLPIILFFFFNDTATTEIYTLSLHDALPISVGANLRFQGTELRGNLHFERHEVCNLRLLRFRWKSRNKVSGLSKLLDRKSTRLNSSHSQISYAVFCLKKKHHDLNHNI